MAYHIEHTPFRFQSMVSTSTTSIIINIILDLRLSPLMVEKNHSQSVIGLADKPHDLTRQKESCDNISSRFELKFPGCIFQIKAI